MAFQRLELVLSLFTALLCTAQGLVWTKDTSVGGTKEWYSVAMSSDGTTQTAVVYNGSIWTSTDSGATWNEDTSVGSTTYWTSVAMSSDGTTQTAVGDGGSIWTSTDSGVTWTEDTSVKGTKSWSSVAMSSDGTTQTAVVYSGNIWTSTDSGATWNEDTSVGSAQGWGPVAMSSDGTTQTAVVYYNGSIWTSTDSGATWNEDTSVGSTTYWSSVAMSSDGTTQTAMVDGGNIWTSTDSGVTWTEDTSVEGTKRWSSVAMSSDGTTQTAVIYNGTIWTSTDSGVTWNEDTSVNVKSRKEWMCVAMSSDGTTQTAVTDRGNIWTATAADPVPSQLPSHQLTLEEWLCQCSPDGRSYYGRATAPKSSYDITRGRHSGHYVFEGCGAHINYAEGYHSQIGGYKNRWCFTIGGKDCSIVGTNTNDVVCWGGDELPGQDPYKSGKLKSKFGSGNECPARKRPCSDRGALDCGAIANNSVAEGTLLSWEVYPSPWTGARPKSRELRDWTWCCGDCSLESACTHWDYDVSTGNCSLYSSVDRFEPSSWSLTGAPGRYDQPLYCMFRNNRFGTCNDNFESLVIAGVVLSVVGLYLWLQMFLVSFDTKKALLKEHKAPPTEGIACVPVVRAELQSYQFDSAHTGIASVRVHYTLNSEEQVEVRWRKFSFGSPAVGSHKRCCWRYFCCGCKEWTPALTREEKAKHVERELPLLEEKFGVWLNMKTGQSAVDEINAEVVKAETVVSDAREKNSCCNSCCIAVLFSLPGLLCIMVLCIQLVFSSGGRFIASHRLGDADGEWTSADTVVAEVFLGVTLTTIALVLFGVGFGVSLVQFIEIQWDGFSTRASIIWALENSYELPPKGMEPVLLATDHGYYVSGGESGNARYHHVWKLKFAKSVNTQWILQSHIMRGRLEEYMKRGEDAALSCRSRYGGIGHLDLGLAGGSHVHPGLLGLGDRAPRIAPLNDPLGIGDRVPRIAPLNGTDAEATDTDDGDLELELAPAGAGGVVELASASGSV